MSPPRHDAVAASESAQESWTGGRKVALVDLLDRLLAGGVVVTGDLVLGIADVDLVHISLRALIRSLGPEGDGEHLPWTPLTAPPPDNRHGTAERNSHEP